MVVVSKTDAAINGLVSFNFKVVGPYYTWYERPFIQPDNNVV